MYFNVSTNMFKFVANKNINTFCPSVQYFLSSCFLSIPRTGMGDRFSALLISLMALPLTLADRNPYRPCTLFIPLS